MSQTQLQPQHGQVQLQSQQQVQQQAPPGPQQSADCPILIWMLSLNREYTRDEYDACYQIVKECVPHVTIPHDPRNPESFRQLITQMLPLLMMRHRRIPRSQWQDMSTAGGKHWIQQSSDNLPPEKFMSSMIGYHLTVEESLCGMAMTQGAQRKVVNIGLGIKQVEVQPRGIPVSAYLESVRHKLTPLELTLLTSDTDNANPSASDTNPITNAPPDRDAIILRRLSLILAFKQAYIKAIGQPMGFDWSRLEVNLPAQKAYGDGLELRGWEFRIFGSVLGVGRTTTLPAGAVPNGAPTSTNGSTPQSHQRQPQQPPQQGPPRTVIVLESYQCVCAFFRGTRETKFIWHELSSREMIESWVQYLTIDQMVKVIPKLRA